MKKLAVHHKFIVWLGFSIAAGGIAAWAAHQHLEQQRALIAEQTRVPMVPRVVAAYELGAGTVLAESHLAVREFPAQSVPADSLDPQHYGQLVGAVLRSSVVSGDLILAVFSQWASRGDHARGSNQFLSRIVESG